MYLYKDKTINVFSHFVFIALVFAVIAGPASAMTITDYGTITGLGDPLYDPLTSPYETSSGDKMGDLTVSVYYNTGTGIYLYELYLDPGSYYDTYPATHYISTITAPVLGKYSDTSGLRAGYSFSEAVTATAPTGYAGDGGDIFSASWSPFEYSIIFQIQNGSWSGPGMDVEPITFFYESLFGPNMGTYQIANCEPGTAENYAPSNFPVPEPGTILLMFTGLIGLTALKRESLFGIFKRL